jgi:NAD-dependent SIR2 family protein deacetylase
MFAFFVCTQNVDNLHEQAGSRNIVHMHQEFFKSRCDTCSRPPFDDTNLHEPPTELPRCGCGGRIRPHICRFGEVPFELDRIYRWDRCTLFMAIGTSGVTEPAASCVAHVADRAQPIYVVHGIIIWAKRRSFRWHSQKDELSQRNIACLSCKVTCERQGVTGERARLFVVILTATVSLPRRSQRRSNRC